MPPTGNFTLELTGVRANDLNDTAQIELFASSGSVRYSNRERIQRQLTLTRKTHPYDVREILIAAQGLDPGYSFRFT